MRLNIFSWALGGVVAVCGGYGLASAQSGTTSDVPALAQQQVPDPKTPAEALKLAEEWLPGMTSDIEGIKADYQRAVKANDVSKALCIEEKKNEGEVAVRAAADRTTALRDGQSDPSNKPMLDFAVIKALHERVRELVAEAQQCIGEELGTLGKDEVSMQIDPNLPESDPSEFPEDPLLVDPPVIGSPTK